MPGPTKLEKLTSHPGSDLRQLTIQANNAVSDDANAAMAMVTSSVWGWSSTISASKLTLGRGGTDTNIGSGAFRFIITGQAASEAKAAVAAGTAIGAQTVPADKWALYVLDVATGGTITVTAAAANATTGYATEAAAIAALPVPITAKARLGYITVKTKAATAWVAATDALAGGASGNPASVTNYYPFDGMFAPTGVAIGPDKVTVTCGGAAVQGGQAAVANGGMWTVGRNGILAPTVLSIGGTDTNLQTTAFTYNAAGAADLAKAAVAAGTAFGSLGTVPANGWAVIVMLIDSQGTFSFLSGPNNYTTGYSGEGPALGDLWRMYPSANLAMVGYITLKTKAATAWIAGTDALAGGASGNPASITNYYPVAGFVQNPGNTSGQIALLTGKVLGPTNY